LPSKKPTVTLPERLELEYMMDQRRLMRQLEWFTVACLGKFRDDHRQDSPSLRAFLQLSTPEILDEQRLRRRLRQLAGTLTTQKLKELRVLLGRSVSVPSPGLINGWIDEQVLAIQFSVQQWLTTATNNIAEGAASGTTVSEMTAGLKALGKSLGRQAEERASFRILQLNSQIIEEVSRGAGSTGYRWVTEDDSRVRPHHAELEQSIQRWDTPPMGGGTRATDQGAPGSGYGCRCIAEPLPGQAPLSAAG
jgi:hypothetical protein